MKKYLLSAVALLIAVVLVSFAKQKETGWKNENRFPDVFLVYHKELGYQNSLDSYTQHSMSPVSCSGSDKLCWFKADDIDFNGIIDYMEFSLAFYYLDNNCNGSLDDEAESSYLLEKKFALF